MTEWALLGKPYWHTIHTHIVSGIKLQLLLNRHPARLIREREDHEGYNLKNKTGWSPTFLSPCSWLRENSNVIITANWQVGIKVLDSIYVARQSLNLLAILRPSPLKILACGRNAVTSNYLCWWQISWGTLSSEGCLWLINSTSFGDKIHRGKAVRHTKEREKKWYKAYICQRYRKADKLNQLKIWDSELVCTIAVFVSLNNSISFQWQSIQQWMQKLWSEKLVTTQHTGCFIWVCLLLGKILF